MCQFLDLDCPPCRPQLDNQIKIVHFKMSKQSVSTNGDAKALDAAFKRIKSSMKRNGYFNAELLDSTLQGITLYMYHNI